MSPLELATPQFFDLAHHYMLLVVEDKARDGMTSLHQEINNVLLGELGTAATRHRVDERGLRMPSWWDEGDSAGVTLEQAQAAALGMRRR